MGINVLRNCGGKELEGQQLIQMKSIGAEPLSFSNSTATICTSPAAPTIGIKCHEAFDRVAPIDDREITITAPALIVAFTKAE